MPWPWLCATPPRAPRRYCDERAAPVEPAAGSRGGAPVRGAGPARCRRTTPGALQAIPGQPSRIRRTAHRAGRSGGVPRDAGRRANARPPRRRRNAGPVRPGPEVRSLPPPARIRPQGRAHGREAVPLGGWRPAFRGALQFHSGPGRTGHAGLVRAHRRIVQVPHQPPTHGEVRPPGREPDAAGTRGRVRQQAPGGAGPISAAARSHLQERDIHAHGTRARGHASRYVSRRPGAQGKPMTPPLRLALVTLLALTPALAQPGPTAAPPAKAPAANQSPAARTAELDARLDEELRETGGNRTEIVAVLEKHLQAHPDCPKHKEIIGVLAQLAVDGKDRQRQLKYGHEAIENGSRDSRLLQFVTRELLNQEDAESKARALKYALLLIPLLRTDIKNQLASTTYAPGQVRHLDETEFTLKEALVYQARALDRLGRNEEALKPAAEAWEIQPSLDAALERALVLERLARQPGLLG